MKKSFFSNVAAAGLVAGTLFSGTAMAAPRQYVVVVAEGLSPQLLSLGQGYLRKSDEDPELVASLGTLIGAGKTTAPGAVTDLKGLLETAEQNGYKTGLVTTASLAAVAPLFYELGANPTETIVSGGAKYDFLAGGGRTAFTPAQLTKYKTAGNTYISNVEEMESEVKGGTLVLHEDGDLNYAIDRQPELEASLTDLTTLALDTLGANNAPFVLVVHDTLVKKALETKDSPALVEQFREINTLLTELSARRDENPSLALAALWTGSAATPTIDPAAASNSFFVLSNLGLSFAGVSKALKGADAATIDTFVSADEGVYKGWKVSAADKAKITAGTLTGEAAVRAAYEPALKIAFDGPAGTPGAIVVGLEAPAGLAAALKAAVSKAAAPAA